MGSGSIRQRTAGSWELRVYQGTDPTTGRSRYATRTVRGSRRAAERALRELAVEVGHARVHAGTVGGLLARWYADASPGWAPTTAAHTRSIVDHHLIPQLGHVRLGQLTTVVIDDLYGRLLRGDGSGGVGLAPGTVHRIHGVLHRALAQAQRWEWIWINPATMASPPRVRRVELVPPTPAQVAALLASVQTCDPALHGLLRLAATTGARRGQLLALRWRDLDLTDGVAAFTRAVVPGPDGPVLTATKTDRTHQVELDHQTLATLQALRCRADRLAADAGTVVTGESFVFTSDLDGRRPWRPDRVTHAFARARQQAGLGHFRLHDLRHFMATQMLAAGIPIALVAQRLNHARISTTLNVYTHAIRAGDRPAAETLAALIDVREERFLPWSEPLVLE